MTDTKTFLRLFEENMSFIGMALCIGALICMTITRFDMVWASGPAILFGIMTYLIAMRVNEHVGHKALILLTQIIFSLIISIFGIGIAFGLIIAEAAVIFVIGISVLACDTAGKCRSDRKAVETKS